MALLHYLWSRVAASNATADAAINMAEGMAPSAVNDGIRALMASAAGFRDDISGAIVTTGTSTAYAVASYQVFDTLAHMSGQLIAFSPHTTNGATVTLNVDGLGARPLRQSPSVELPAGVLIQGSPYVALYNNSDAAWYLQNFYINPYSIPIAGGIDYWGTTTPNSAFAFPAGQAISRTTYSVLFGIMGTTYGVGDGSTTFNLPDKTGRVSAMVEASATRLTTAGSGVDGDTMGAAGGVESVTLAANQIPTITSAGSNSISVGPSGKNFPTFAGSVSSQPSPSTGGNQVPYVGGTWGSDNLPLTGDNSITVAYTNGSQVVTKTIPPLIVCNYIIRVI